MKRVPLFLLALLPTAAAAAPQVDLRAVAVSVVEETILPGYAALAEATAAQAAEWKTFCAAPKRAGFPRLEQAFRNAADAWSRVEFVRYGPISEGFRFERMAHWPERRNAVSRGLTKLLSRTGADDLTPERFSQTSVAVQGLTALERLLFDGDEARAAFLDGSPAAARRCAVASAAASGMERLAATVRNEWKGSNGLLARLRAADETTAREAVTRLATDLFSLYEAVADRKLSAVMGESLEEVRPTLAEGWRSGRTMRAVTLDLEAAAALTRPMLASAGASGDSILASLASAQEIAASLPPDLGAAAADPKQRGRLLLLVDFIRSARDLSAQILPAALGITLGFNSLDGD